MPKLLVAAQFSFCVTFGGRRVASSEGVGDFTCSGGVFKIGVLSGISFAFVFLAWNVLLPCCIIRS